DPDPILKAPDEAYRTEVMSALKEAMLAHSSSLGIGPNEWLTIAARGNDDRPRIAPADSGSRTRIMRLRGSDLALYLARQITKDEAMERNEVRVHRRCKIGALASGPQPPADLRGARAAG